jgi:hypothetical protein
VVPLPPEANVSVPGFAFARVTMSDGDDAGLPGWATITVDARPSSAIGAKSLRES